jgi:hypothetical protein
MTAVKKEQPAYSFTAGLTRPPAPEPKPAPVPAPAAEPAATAPPPSRVGKRKMTIHMPPGAWQQLMLLKIQEGASLEALALEALNDLFTKRGMNRFD